MDFDSLPEDSVQSSTPPATPEQQVLPNSPQTAEVSPNIPQNNQNLPDFDSLPDDEDTYGSLGQQAITGLEGTAQGVIGAAAPLIETKLLGVKPEDIRLRAETNPFTHGATETLGLAGSMLTGQGEGALALKAGEKAAEFLNLGGKGASLASKIGAAAAEGAITNALIQGGDETSKLITSDPEASTGVSAIDGGLGRILEAGMMGGAFGVALPIAGAGAKALWKGAEGSKVGQTIADFKGRMAEHMTNPNPVETVSNELGDYYKNLTNVADEVYGPQGLKAQEIQKMMPVGNDEKIMSQANEISENLTNRINKMANKPNSYPDRLVSKLNSDLDEYHTAISSAENHSEVFNAVQDLKQKIQGYAKYDKFVKPVDEAYDFVKDAKDLAFDLRNKLEDPGVWGKAAERQQAINKAFSKFLPTLNDFNKKFTTEINGDRVIDPGKINTYINQLGKPNAEIKQEMLSNFIDAAKKYQDVLNQTHVNLGIESPIPHSSLNYTMKTLQKQPLGAKLADAFINKHMSKGLGHGAGSVVGGVVGGLFGHPGLGAIVGANALGPFFESILPAIAKPLLEAANKPEAFKAVADYGIAVAKGENALSKATENLFKEGSGAEVVPERLKPKEADKSKLEKMLKALRVSPDQLLNGSDVSHYLPQHGVTISQTAASGVQYLNSLQPSKEKSAPLDSEPVPNSFQKAQYNRALNIAVQPLTILEKIKDGTVNPFDLGTLKVIYPGLYKRMSMKLTDQIATQVSKGKTIPYRTRMGLSMFLGQALDSTMSPGSIISAQIGQAGTPQQQAPQQASAPRAPHSTANLNKISNLYRTPAQVADQRRQRLPK